MEVLILSKTHIGAAACVGGMVMQTFQPVRLHNGVNTYQPGNTEFEVGQIWDLDFTAHPDAAPHIEDVIIQNRRFVQNIEDIRAFILANCVIWRGGPQALFNGALQWTGNGSGYINAANVPANSVGFWISDRDLTLGHTHYVYPNAIPFFNPKRFGYVGYAPAIGVIPAGTLIRISLAKWWRPEGTNMELRCYSQLSGWY